MVLDRATYLNAFRSDTGALADAARLGLQVPLPCCPGWTIATLLGHLGATYISIDKNIRLGHGEDVMQELEDLELAPDVEDWFKHRLALERTPRNVVEWLGAAAAALDATFRTADPHERTWTWLPQNQSVGFWIRRMAHETAVHRWDAELAHDRARPIDRELAQDGIEEVLTVYQPRWCRPESKVAGRGETYRFEQTDGPGNWIMQFKGEGMQVRHDHAKADMVIRGSASDLLLFLWHRIPADRLEVWGNDELVSRYFELAPPD